MTVYLDSFILVNFFINYLLLLATKKLHNSKTTYLKMIAGSILGVIYSLFMFVKNSNFIYTHLGKFIFSLLLTAFVYKHSGIYDYIRTVVVFYIATFMFGGCAYALINKAEITFIFAATAAAYTVMSVFAEFYKRLSVSKNLYAEVEIISNDKSVSVTGLVDTGNSLYDPYTKLPVIIVSKDYTKVFSNPLRLIPYKSIGKNNGLISAFTPDKVTINGKETKCVIGIYNDKLSADGRFGALINPDGSVYI